MRLHVIPVCDRKGKERFDHTASCRCGCQPLEETVGRGHKLYTHHAFDLREKWERQHVWRPETHGWATIEE
jgi:hypothetical protein